MEKKQRLGIILSTLGVIMILFGVTYSFFNYTRTGSSNVIKVGRISFVSRQTDTINLTNLFPIDPTEPGIMDDATKVGTLEIEIEGDTDYSEGVEYLISAVDSSITTNSKVLPISLDITVTTLGTESSSYWTSRESKNATIYKKLVDETLDGNGMLLVGYIKPNTTSGTAEGVDGTITIKAYLDENKILISDTYNNGETPMVFTDLKSELEDLSLRYLKPDVYYDIVEKLNGTKTERDNIINEMMREVSDLLTEHNIVHEIKGRSKSIYSIYNKLDKGRKFSDIYDLLAIRILVHEESECYLVLGLIHSKFKPIAKRFKDFIAMPKSNGYQSLHTTVFGINNELFEIQIRTYDMNDIAENGVAAHWSYKENKSAFNLSRTDAKLEFFKAVIDMNQNEFSTDSVYNTIKEENSDDVIYVFTPKGDVIELPKGSTPVDFAYRVHTKIGDSMIGALVNNQIVPLNRELSDGDVVKINTSKSSSGPSEDWLNFVKLTQTKNKIKSFFAKNRRDELINFGKESLEKELRKRKISINDFMSSNNIKKILKITKEENDKANKLIGDELKEQL